MSRTLRTSFLTTLLFVASLFVYSTMAARPPEPLVDRIAFGSCNKQSAEQPLWSAIRSQNPDVWVWMGDNVYADTESMQEMQADYAEQQRHPGYRGLRNDAAVIGTWDDHDYGVNDGDRTYAQRDSSQQLFLDFMNVAPDDPRRLRRGVYSAHTYGPPGQQVKVILLDTRYHRDPLERLDTDAQLYAPSANGDILGDAQWAWLEHELRTSNAQVHVIGTSIQALSAEHRWEKWANYPAARERLFRVLRRSEAPGVVLISGDRHHGELSRHNDAIGYPLYELTASGLTHTADNEGEPNRLRVGDMVTTLHYGTLAFDFDRPDPQIQLALHGQGDAPHLAHTVPLSDLQP